MLESKPHTLNDPDVVIAASRQLHIHGRPQQLEAMKKMHTAWLVAIGPTQGARNPVLEALYSPSKRDAWWKATQEEAARKKAAKKKAAQEQPDGFVLCHETLKYMDMHLVELIEVQHAGTLSAQVLFPMIEQADCVTGQDSDRCAESEVSRRHCSEGAF
jgi:hypothetical protein